MGRYSAAKVSSVNKSPPSTLLVVVKVGGMGHGPPRLINGKCWQAMASTQSTCDRLVGETGPSLRSKIKTMQEELF